MTKEEALKIWLPVIHTGVKDMPECKEALDMAIRALEREPCDKCEVGNPCLYCKHEFEPRESEDRNDI